MKSSVVKRSIVIDGHKTSVSLEDAFWTDLKMIAHTQQTTLSELVTKIDGTRDRAIYPRRSACLFFSTSVMKTSEWRRRKRIFPRWVLKEHQQASLSRSATVDITAMCSLFG